MIQARGGTRASIESGGAGRRSGTRGREQEGERKEEANQLACCGRREVSTGMRGSAKVVGRVGMGELQC